LPSVAGFLSSSFHHLTFRPWISAIHCPTDTAILIINNSPPAGRPTLPHLPACHSWPSCPCIFITRCPPSGSRTCIKPLPGEAFMEYHAVNGALQKRKAATGNTNNVALWHLAFEAYPGAFVIRYPSYKKWHALGNLNNRGTAEDSIRQRIVSSVLAVSTIN